MNKPRLLIWGDSPTANSGFGRVTKNLCEYLHNDFDISILGINYFGTVQYDTSKYFIYTTDKDDKLGINRFPHIVKDCKPTIILLFQDIFNIYRLQKTHPSFFDTRTIPTAIYFPVDGTPFSKVWQEAISPYQKVITYTDWGIQQIKESLPALAGKHIDRLYHGIDTTIFYPETTGRIKQLRRDFGWEDKFVISNVNRFQPRKHINQTLRIASLFIHGFKECDCGNIYPIHLNYCDLNGCDSSHVTSIMGGHNDALLYLHMNFIEDMMGISPSDYLTSHALNNGFSSEENNKNIMFNATPTYGPSAPTDKDLNDIYNASNITLSTSLGEGFGLSTGESLATGTPVIVGKHSANFELTNNGTMGHLVDNLALCNWGRDSGQVRPIMGPRAALEAIYKEYNLWIQNDNRKKIIYPEFAEYIKQTFNWEVEGTKLLNILKEIVPI